MKRFVLAFAMAASVLAGILSAPALAQESSGAKQKLNVAILIFDGVQIIDYTGPYEALGAGRRRTVYTVAE
jgi:hypothetical protein